MTTGSCAVAASTRVVTTPAQGTRTSQASTYGVQARRTLAACRAPCRTCSTTRSWSFHAIQRSGHYSVGPSHERGAAMSIEAAFAKVAEIMGMTDAYSGSLGPGAPSLEEQRLHRINKLARETLNDLASEPGEP